MIKIIKTLDWTDVSATLFQKYARLQKLGSATIAKPKNFVEFMASYPLVSLKDMITFVEKVDKHAKLKDVDVTNVATLTEDSCLFATNGDSATALQIVMQYLKTLNTGGKVPALWCFLDDDKKVIVHFVNRKGYYAEIYCLTNENASALHLLTVNEQKSLVPVIFTTAFDDDVLQHVNELGANCLHDYLPREKYDFLSKGGKRNAGIKSYRNSAFVQEHFGLDSGDSL